MSLRLSSSEGARRRAVREYTATRADHAAACSFLRVWSTRNRYKHKVRLATRLQVRASASLTRARPKPSEHHISPRASRSQSFIRGFIFRRRFGRWRSAQKRPVAIRVGRFGSIPDIEGTGEVQAIVSIISTKTREQVQCCTRAALRRSREEVLRQVCPAGILVASRENASALRPRRGSRSR